MAEGLDKNLFYKKMQPYFDNGIVREICSTDHFSVMRLGEIIYVACPYLLLADEPHGIYMNQKILREIMKDPSEFYSILQDISNNFNKYKQLVYYFSSENVDLFKQWIKDSAHAIQFDDDFEAELKELSKNCPKREPSIKSEKNTKREKGGKKEKKQKRKWFR